MQLKTSLRRAGLSAAIVLFLLPAVASAEPGDPSIVLTSPADGAQIAVQSSYPQYQRVQFTFTCPQYHASPSDPGSNWSRYSYEVATRPDLGPDGTLATAYEIWSDGAYPTNAAETECRSSSGWPIYPSPLGTYYWQVHRICAAPFGSSCPGDDYSPVYSFTIVAPPPPAGSGAGGTTGGTDGLHMSRGQALNAVWFVIRHQIHRAPLHLTKRCFRRTGRTFRCSVSWSDRHYAWAGDLTLTLTRLYEDGSFDVRASFRGLRASQRCLRHHSVQHCALHLRW